VHQDHKGSNPMLITQSISMVPDTVCFVYHLHCGLKYQHWPMKQTLTVDQNGYQWHTVLHTVQKKLMLKNRRYPQKSMFTATEGPIYLPLVVLGYSVGVAG